MIIIQKFSAVELASTDFEAYRSKMTRQQEELERTANTLQAQLDEERSTRWQSGENLKEIQGRLFSSFCIYSTSNCSYAGLWFP